MFACIWSPCAGGAPVPPLEPRQLPRQFSPIVLAALPRRTSKHAGNQPQIHPPQLSRVLAASWVTILPSGSQLQNGNEPGHCHIYLARSSGHLPLALRDGALRRRVVDVVGIGEPVLRNWPKCLGDICGCVGEFAAISGISLVLLV